MQRRFRLREYSLFVALFLLLRLPVGCRKSEAAVSEPTPPQVTEAIAQPTPLVALSPKAPISQAGIDLIINEETGGKYEYNPHPEWPGASSGVTVGVGYDCGQTNKSLIYSDWNKVREDWLTDLANTSGITGERAKPVAKNLSFIAIEWGLANEVFTDATLPQYWTLTQRTFPGVENLCPNAAASLTSIVYNRGSSMVGDSRREMRAIRTLVPKKDYQGIAQQVLDMRRLWYGKNLDGLITRREHEAQLILTCVNE